MPFTCMMSPRFSDFHGNGPSVIIAAGVWTLNSLPAQGSWPGGDTGLMATLVPDLAVSGLNRLLSLDLGIGLGFFPKYQFGTQNFGGPVQIVETAGIRSIPSGSFVYRVSCPALLRRRRLWSVRSRRGHVPCGARLQILTRTLSERIGPLTVSKTCLTNSLINKATTRRGSKSVPFEPFDNYY